MALKTTSRIVRGRQQKIKSLVARLALMICAKKNPSLYKRYELQRSKYLQLKMMVIKKNTPAAIMAARKLLSGAGASQDKK